MKIGPWQESRRLVPAEPPRATVQETAPRHGKTEDSVTISDDARKRLARQADSLLEREQAKSPVYSLPGRPTDTGASTRGNDTVRADILNEIKHRIDSGYYEREDIKRLIADRLLDNLNG